MKSVIVYCDRWLSTNVKYLGSQLIQTIIVCFATCWAVKNNAFSAYSETKTCLFAILMCCIWSGLFNSICLFFSESGFILDELSKMLKTYTYMVSNFFIQLTLCLAEAVCTTIIMSFFFKMNASGLILPNGNLDYSLTLWLVIFSSDMLGFAIGVAIKDIKGMLSTVPLVLIIQMLFSGCLVPLNGTFITRVSTVTSAKWGFNAMAAIADLNSYIKPEQIQMHLLEQASEYEHIASNARNYWLCLGMIAFVCFIVAWLFLYLRINSKADKK